MCWLLVDVSCLLSCDVGRCLLVVDYCLWFGACCLSFAVRRCLLVVFSCLLMLVLVPCEMPIICCSLFVVTCFVVDCWSLFVNLCPMWVARCSLFVVGCWLLFVVDCYLLVIK